jgi:hypothetical protein
MEFADGTTPSNIHVIDFAKILENEIDLRQGAVYVHCRSGLGRTGTMICIYLMYKHGFPAKEAIAWTRLCRPGSVLGIQQQFLVDLAPTLKKLMGEAGDLESSIRKDPTNEERPYPHCNIEPENKPDYMQKSIYKPKKFQQQLDELYGEINKVQYDNYKVSTSGSRYDTLNLIGSLKDDFNP